ncbi:MAG TPA: NAD(P)-binding protein, partial [Kiritimatiellia bacterium]|nr:NAD(P)-binding protein [Kiritimatiellia bacterium]
MSYLVVGSGFYGATMAERIASVLGERVMVIEKRAVVGGNSFSRADEETGIEIHLHGSHIFHTRDSRIWEYVRSFGAFNAYRHHVLASHHGRVYPMPVCLWTLNQFFGRVF